MKIAKEGWARIVLLLLIVLIMFALSSVLGGFLRVVLLHLSGIILLLCGFLAYFFRDPDREYPEGDDLVLSPADGRVIDVSHNGESYSIKIFMSPLDVHVQRSPVSGMVESVNYTSGKFMRAYDASAALENERNSIKIRDDKLQEFEVIQIAGTLARRIVCYVRGANRVSRGERIGMIMLGSQVNLKVPSSVKIQVKPGDRLTAGVSIVGRTNI